MGHGVEPLIVLIVLPVLIGLGAEWLFHDMRRASVAATVGCTLFLYACLGVLDPEGTWNWLATLLVLPLPISLALAAVIIYYGRSQAQRHHRRHDA